MNIASNANLNKHELQNAVMQNLATAPLSPVEGQMYYDTVDDLPKIYRGGSWQNFVNTSGGGDASTNTATSVDNEIALFSGTTGKLFKRASTTGILKGASGVISAATAGTDYTTPASTETFTNKTIDANGTGNSISNLETADFAANVVDNDSTLTANSSSRLPTQAAVKAYVDALSQGLKWKEPVRAATTAAGTLASGFENGDTIDGVVLATNDRIFIKDQAAGAENGIYTVNASGAPTRAADANTGTELKDAVVIVMEGTVNADHAFKVSNDTGITLGTTVITVIDFVLANVPAASTTVSGKAELAIAAEAEAKSSSSLALTPASVLNFPIKKTFTIGDGTATSYALTHSLGTKDVIVSVRKASTDEQWYVDVTCTSTTVVTLVFATAPTTNEFVVTVIG